MSSFWPPLHRVTAIPGLSISRAGLGTGLPILVVHAVGHVLVTREPLCSRG